MLHILHNVKKGQPESISIFHVCTLSYVWSNRWLW